jgi:hypothetical protein
MPGQDFSTCQSHYDSSIELLAADRVHERLHHWQARSLCLRQAVVVVYSSSDVAGPAHMFVNNTFITARDLVPILNLLFMLFQTPKDKCFFYDISVFVCKTFPCTTSTYVLFYIHTK